ncbi:hypothetical protein OG218_00905 [Kineococcus sp. NBC_00420]|uniref:hypothetical protein n=1 Tax=Kineococcus sp. NBC_00420 TaxID=2903564 RepID=UPI002E247ACB
MAPRTRSLLALGTASLALTVLTSCGTSTPDADAVIAGSHDLLASSQQQLLLGPVPGTGSESLPDFTVDGAYEVKVRCIGDGAASITIDGQNHDPGNCSDGMTGLSSEATGQSVHVSVDGSEDLYWVAAVFRCTQTESTLSC